MKIDCSNTLNYLKEKNRMTKVNNKGFCTIYCSDCSLSHFNNGTTYDCIFLEKLFPEKALNIVQNWSDNNPIHTYLSDFLSKFPNAKLDSNGIPINVYPCSLGYTCNNEKNCECNCEECWKKPLVNFSNYILTSENSDLGHVNTTPTTVLNMADKIREKEEMINNFLTNNGYGCKVKIIESEDYQLPLPYVSVKLAEYSIYLVSKADRMTIDDITLDIILNRLPKFIIEKISNTSQFLR